MKQLFSLLAAATISLGAFAQNGSIAPNFTATDINGIQHDLYSYLDSGYAVILDFSAAWCPPCWDYHVGGALKTLHEVYGPDSLNQIRVIYLECEDTNTSAQLNGVNAGNTYATASEGDFVTGTPYPIIDNAGSIANDFNVTGFPTILTVCPNRFVTESGQANVAAHASIFQNSECQFTTLNNDAFLVNSVSDALACQGEATLAVTLMNNGLDVLSECTIKAFDGSTEVGSVNWSGSLDTYETETVTVTTAAPVEEQTTFNIEVTSSDESVANNSVSASIGTRQESTNNIQFTLLLDGFPTEVQWAVFNDMGQVVEDHTPYTIADAHEEITYWWTLPLGCYSFVIADAYGDGLHSSWYFEQQNENPTGPDGSFSLDAMDGLNVSTNLYDYSAPDEYSVREVGFEVTSVSEVEELHATPDMVIFPNPTTGVSNIQFTNAIAGETSMEVTNLLGERILMEDFGTLPAGTQRMELNLEGFEAGVYLVNVSSGGETTTMRVTKQ